MTCSVEKWDCIFYSDWWVYGTVGAGAKLTGRPGGFKRFDAGRGWRGAIYAPQKLTQLVSSEEVANLTSPKSSAQATSRHVKKPAAELVIWCNSKKHGKHWRTWFDILAAWGCWRNCLPLFGLGNYCHSCRRPRLCADMCRNRYVSFFWYMPECLACSPGRWGLCPSGSHGAGAENMRWVHCNFDWTHTHSYTFYHIFLIAFNLSNGFFQCDWLMSIAGRRIGLRTSWYVAYCFGIRGDAPLKSSSSIITWFAMEHNSRRRTLPPPFSMIWSQSVYIDRLHVILYCIYFYLFNIYLYMHHYHVSNIYSIASSKQISKIFQWN